MVNINWPAIGAFLSSVAGSVGLVVTGIWGSHLGSAVQSVIMAVSGLLIAIPVHHAASAMAARSKLRYAADLAALRPVPQAVQELHDIEA